MKRHTSSRRRRCPHVDCPSNAAGSRPSVIRHSRMPTRRGLRRRYLCKRCRRTFVPTLGTPYYRMRRPRIALDRAMRLSAEGVSQASIARASGVCASTVTRWRERVALHAHAFVLEHLTVRDPVEVQLDELRGIGAGKEGRSWIYNSIEVWSRVWASWRIGRRTLRSTRLFTRETRSRLGPATAPILFSSDKMKYYEPSLRKTFGLACVHVQVRNRYREGRIVRTAPRLTWGTEWRYEIARSRSEDSQRPNTAYVERLNLFVRRACPYLHRRTPWPMRKRHKLAECLAILQCYYNFVRPHASLKFGRVTRTPAMQAGIFDRPLSFREIFSWVPKPSAEPVRLPWS